MVPIEQRFAELIGKVLGKRWFDKEQHRHEMSNERQKQSNPTQNSKTS